MEKKLALPLAKAHLGPCAESDTMSEKEYTVLIKLDNETRDKAKTQARLLGIRLSEHYRNTLTSGLNEFQNADLLEEIKQISA